MYDFDNLVYKSVILTDRQKSATQLLTLEFYIFWIFNFQKILTKRFETGK